MTRYGQTGTVELAEIACLWYGAFGNTKGRVVLVREPEDNKMLALFTTNTTSNAKAIVARYAHRWPI